MMGRNIDLVQFRTKIFNSDGAQRVVYVQIIWPLLYLSTILICVQERKETEELTSKSSLYVKLDNLDLCCFL